MDPITGPTLVLEAWKVGGIAGGLVALIALIVWLGWKDARADKRRLIATVERCQEGRDNLLEKTASLIANNNHALSRLGESIDQQTLAMRDRPCLKDPTPPGGHRHPFPTPRPQTDHRI